jgi:cytochrome b561
MFYTLMIGLPLSGWLALPRLIFRKPEFAGIKMFGLDAVLPPTLDLPMGLIHNIGSKVGIALLFLHVAAALKHHFINRDDVLARMLPRHH